jgi:hypothetical protein
MKQHKKIYEDVFSTDNQSSRHKFSLDKVTVGNGEDLGQYITQFTNFLGDFYNQLFDGFVRLSWLRRKFTYCDLKTRFPMYKNALVLNLAFVKFLRRFIGKDIQIITRGKSFSKIETYFDEMFPGFMEGNPFENPEYYKFPYKNITLDYLIVVQQMDDRLKLLEIADHKEMTYAVFMDYVINHAYAENDDLGYPRYQIKHNQDKNFPFCIRDTHKDLQTKRGRKRK